VQRRQRGAVDHLEEVAATALEPFEETGVQPFQQFPDGGVEFGQTEKVRLRNAARIQRSTTSTPTSTLALSRGLRGRVGMTTVP